MDTSQWTQGLNGAANQVEKKPRPPKEEALNCPRCNSINTKFCYYNNYSLSQPRYFCKTCRRYWTNGGSMRNVPVGGGSRKNRRPSSSSSAASSSKKQIIPDLSPRNFSIQNPKIHEGHDLNLAYNPAANAHYDGLPEFVSLPLSFGHDGTKSLNLENPNPNNNPYQLPVMEFLKAGINSRGENNSFNIPMPVSDSNSLYSSGVSVHELIKPSLNFSMDGLENGYGINLQGVDQDHTNTSKIVFPFEDSKNNEAEADKSVQGEEESNGYWNGMLGGGSW